MDSIFDSVEMAFSVTVASIIVGLASGLIGIPVFQYTYTAAWWLLTGAGSVITLATTEAIPPETAYQTVRRRIRETTIPIKSFAYEFADDLLSVDLWMIGACCPLLIALWWSTKPLIAKGKRLARSYSYYVRGIEDFRGEAFVMGSNFEPGVSPRFQVGLYRPGLLMDTFAGYGLRYRDLLIMPNHVYNTLGGDDHFIAEGRGRVAVLKRPTFSKRFSDVVYCKCSSSELSRMGASELSFTDCMKSAAATIFGPQGTTAGVVVKTRLPSMLSYKGTTAPGYSGAAYVVNGQAYGMHLGASGDENIGVSVKAMIYEIKSMFIGESKSGNQYSNGFISGDSEAGDNDDVWDDEKFDRYHNDPRSRHMTFEEWDREEKSFKPHAASRKVLVSDYAQVFDDMSVADIQLLISAAQTNISSRPARVKVTGQSSDEATFVMEIASRTLEDRVEELERLVSVLLDWRTEATQPQPAQRPAVVGFKCDKCDRTLKSKQGMMVHSITVHGEVARQPKKIVGETAFPSDSAKTVATKPVFQKPSLGRKSSAPSTPASPRSTDGLPSTSQSQSQSKTATSTNAREKCFEELLATISGLGATLERLRDL